MLPLVGLVGAVGDVTVGPELVGVVVGAGAGAGAEIVPPVGAVGAGVVVDGVTLTEPPPKLIEGVTATDSNADAAGPLPPLPANSAAAAPPITAERMMNFFFEGCFNLKILVCGISALEVESL
jgi:hypothetical protein